MSNQRPTIFTFPGPNNVAVAKAVQSDNMGNCAEVASLDAQRVKRNRQFEERDRKARRQDRYADSTLMQLLNSAGTVRRMVPAKWSRSEFLAAPSCGHFSTYFHAHYEGKEADKKVALGYIQCLLHQYGTKPNDFLCNEDWYVRQFLDTGECRFLELAAENSLLVYALGPFMLTGGTDRFVTFEHQKYHERILAYGKATYILAYMHFPKKVLGLMSESFAELGNMLSTCARKC